MRISVNVRNGSKSGRSRRSALGHDRARPVPARSGYTLFALATGLRQANVQFLRWEQVDLDRRTMWIYGDRAKGDEDIHVSLSSFAVEILQRQVGWHKEFVFTRQGKPITEVNTKSWRKAVLRAGITNFRWHDLRHTWATWLVQTGRPCMHCRRWAGGSRWRWCGGTRTWPLRTWPRMRKWSARCSLWQRLPHVTQLGCREAPNADQKDPLSG